MCKEGELTVERVLVVGSVQSYLIHACIARLEEDGVETLFSNGNINQINSKGNVFNGILLFADEVLIEDQQFLVYIKDIAEENKTPIFTVGYPEHMKLVYGIIPKKLIKREFLRPINANDVEHEVCAFIKSHDISKKKKILVVNDSAATLRSIKTLLDKKYNIVLASSGTMALKYLGQDKPDLILLDYDMPVLNGRQVLGMIRADAEYAQMPVIFLTSRGDRESIMKVVDLKPNGYLLKTMELKTVENAIDEFFAKQEKQG